MAQVCRGWTSALQLLQDMQNCGISPDEVTCNSLMSACGQQRWDVSLQLFLGASNFRGTIPKHVEFTVTFEYRYGTMMWWCWQKLIHCDTVLNLVHTYILHISGKFHQVLGWPADQYLQLQLSHRCMWTSWEVGVPGPTKIRSTFWGKNKKSSGWCSD